MGAFAGLLTSSLISGGTSLLGGLLGSSAAKKAAEAQANATRYAADLNAQYSKDALSLQSQQFDRTQHNLAPFIETGQEAVRKLGDATWTPDTPDLMTGFDGQKFGESFTGDPGFQFRLAEGQRALERSSASRGVGLSTGSQKALARFGQDYASNEYQRAYQRSENTFNTNKTNQFNRLASLAGIGQTAVNTQVGADENAANVGGSILTGAGRTAADLATQEGNARASGYVGSANAQQGALAGVGNAAQTFSLLRLLNRQGATPSIYTRIGQPAGADLPPL